MKLQTGGVGNVRVNNPGSARMNERGTRGLLLIAGAVELSLFALE